MFCIISKFRPMIKVDKLWSRLALSPNKQYKILQQTIASTTGLHSHHGKLHAYWHSSLQTSTFYVLANRELENLSDNLSSNKEPVQVLFCQNV